MSVPKPTPMEEEVIQRWLLTNRCCGFPNLCGARCYDDEESWTVSLIAREVDRLRELEGQ